jgi:glycosyltransferase involved in cell wall biosynthesis
MLAIGLVWLRRHIDLNRARTQKILSEEDASCAPATWPRLTVLVAAKDEEHNIARCVESLLAQDYPDLQVVAINDRSSDRTGEILDALAARDARLTALHVDHLPEDWFGKTNAMRVGVERAGGELLCFTDADCTFDSPRLLRAAVAHAQREGLQFLSVLPRLETHGLLEKIVQPVAGALMVFWFPPAKVNDPAKPHAYANGAFMLMSRASYDEIGGHAAVRRTLNEDMHMARAAKRAGIRLQVVPGGDLYRVRMYSGFRQIWRGWTRIFYGCFGTLPRLIATVLVLSIFSLSPYLTLLVSPLVPAGGGWLALAAGFAIVVQQTVLMRFYRVSGARAAWAPSYVLGAVMCLAMMLNAMTRVGGRTVRWRGTSYRGGAKAD